MRIPSRKWSRPLTARDEFWSCGRNTPSRLRALPAANSHREALPLRLCYLGTAYANPSLKSARKRAEFTQGGVELMGLSGAQADAEVVMLALDAMRAAGLEDYMIRNRSGGFLQRADGGGRADAATTETVRGYVEEKNMLAIELLLRGSGAAEAVISRIRELPMLFGGSEVFERAGKLTTCSRCIEALKKPRAVYDILCACGYGEHVSIDLGMVHAIGYYTGMIFRGISPSSVSR